MSRRESPSALRQVAALAGAGVQFAVTVSLCTAAGWWLDERYGTSPWLLLAGGLVGAVAAFYQFYRTVAAVGGEGSTNRRDEEEAD